MTEEDLGACFDRCLILCRETAAAWGISWQEALAALRIWEYTGQARRGYFVEGMSGAQFIRDKDYAAVTRLLQHPEEKTVWINAADPAASKRPEFYARAGNSRGMLRRTCGGSV